MAERRWRLGLTRASYPNCSRPALAVTETASADARRLLVALGGQQNAGKSTLFNLLTGARQHVANYPGVTVEKKTGTFSHGGHAIELVDLPGTYGLTSFSLEERVARDFLLLEQPDVVVNVADASSLRRSLRLTVQLRELGLPVVVALNMMDVAARRSVVIDTDALAGHLGAPVVATVGRRGEGGARLKDAIIARATISDAPPPLVIDYGAMEPAVTGVTEALTRHPSLADHCPPRWLATRLLDCDAEAMRLLRTHVPEPDAILAQIDRARADFETAEGVTIADQIASSREQAVRAIETAVLDRGTRVRRTWSDRIDAVVLNRWLAPVVLLGVIATVYELSIVQGYEVTHYTWPVLATWRAFAAGILPEAGFLYDPLLRALGLWLVDSANTLLNYVPIFLILFSLIAVLEDSGYMARIAVILDRLLRRFGLHGQSTLPYVLSGVFAGGCAVPGVMATRSIPDHRARMATILTAPFMNCLAKVPLYTLLLGVYFADSMSLMMFYIATITLIAALLVAKLLSTTVLSGLETAPFIMELPNYQWPTVRGVALRAVERTWVYVQKVGTVVIAVAVVVFTLLHLPGLSQTEQEAFEARGQAAISDFEAALARTPFAEQVPPQRLVGLVNAYDAYRATRLNADRNTADADFRARFPDLMVFVAPGRDRAERAASRALRNLASARKALRREMRETRIVNSVLGRIGRSLEPVTQFAGFDWKINVALLSSFAARESSVATLGVLFQDGADENQSLEQRVAHGAGGTDGRGALAALAVILFFALYPPCLATTIMVHVQTGSYRWMLFSIAFPTALGLGVASAVYSLGTAVGVDAVTAMTTTYLAALAMLVIVGLAGDWRSRPAAPLPQTST